MKKLIMSVLLFIPLQFISGQDTIITITNDTIFCRIVSILPASIHYQLKGENQQIVGKLIPIEQVLEYVQDSPSPEIKLSDPAVMRTAKPLRPWLMGLQLGGASLLASSTSDENDLINIGIPSSQAKDYSKQLKHGWSLSGDIHYLLSNYLGLGVKYSFFTSSAQKDFTVKINDDYPEYVCMGMKDNQYIHYAGPSVIFRQSLDKNRKFQLNETLSAGYVHYRGESRMDPNQYVPSVLPPTSGISSTIYNLLAESNTWGANAGLSLDYYLIPRLSIGANAGFMYARLTKVKISTKDRTETIALDKQNYEPLSRLDYSLNIRFHF